MNENIFDKLDFGPFRSLLDNDDITDISYDNGGQIWIRSLTQGSLRVEVEGATPEFVEKLAFQCSNVMGTTFNNAKPFLDAESSELRMNFVHQSIATNGIALVIRKTPAKIRLNKDKLISEDYFTPAIHDFLIKCVEGHCNIMVAGETGSGKTEFVKYLASHTKTSEKIITIEDTLELHLDKIFPQRDIVAMKTNNVASYSDVLVTCMRQNPKWILLSEVRSAEAVSAVRNSISSGHNILSTIHADKASAIPYRLYSLMETDLDVNQFLTTIYRYIQIGVHIKAFYSKEYGNFHREMDEVTEFYVDDNNVPQSRIIYQKVMGKPMMCKPSDHLIEYLENQNVDVHDIIKDLPKEMPIVEYEDVDNDGVNDNLANENNSDKNVSDDNLDSNSLVVQEGLETTSDVSSDNEDSTKTVEVVDGQAESIPIVNNGDVQMASPVVQSVVDTSPIDVSQSVVSQSQVPVAQQEVVPQPQNNLAIPMVIEGVQSSTPQQSSESVIQQSMPSVPIAQQVQVPPQVVSQQIQSQTVAGQVINPMQQAVPQQQAVIPAAGSAIQAPVGVQVPNVARLGE